MFGLENSANNFGKSAGLLANTIALRPVQAALGTIFIGTDNLIIYRYNGNSWDVIGGGGFSGANNGLSIDGTNVVLGGQLIEATEIDISGFPITFNADATATARFIIINDAPISQIAYFTSQSAFNDGGIYIGNFETRGTIQSKEYAAQTPTELRLNYDGGSIQLGNGNFGMTFNDSTPIIQTTYGNPYGLQFDFDAQVFNFGDFNNVDAGTSFKIDNSSQIISTHNQSQNIGLELNFISFTFSFGDYNGDNNGTFINIDDTVQKIYFGNALGTYNFLNVPTFTGNATALAGGLVAGDLYRVTGTGNLHIVF